MTARLLLGRRLVRLSRGETKRTEPSFGRIVCADTRCLDAAPVSLAGSVLGLTPELDPDVGAKARASGYPADPRARERPQKASGP